VSSLGAHIDTPDRVPDALGFRLAVSEPTTVRSTSRPAGPSPREYRRRRAEHLGGHRLRLTLPTGSPATSTRRAGSLVHCVPCSSRSATSTISHRPSWTTIWAPSRAEWHGPRSRRASRAGDESDLTAVRCVGVLRCCPTSCSLCGEWLSSRSLLGVSRVHMSRSVKCGPCSGEASCEIVFDLRVDQPLALIRSASEPGRLDPIESGAQTALTTLRLGHEPKVSVRPMHWHCCVAGCVHVRIVSIWEESRLQSRGLLTSEVDRFGRNLSCRRWWLRRLPWWPRRGRAMP